MNKIITHNWRFHLDEVFWYTLLTFLFKDPDLIRTRNINSLNAEKDNKSSILLDVWLDYNLELNNYDHHMFDERLIQTKFWTSLSKEKIRKEVKKNIKSFLLYNWILLEKNENNKFIQTFRKEDSEDKEITNIEYYKTNDLTKDIQKYLYSIHTNNSFIDIQDKFETLINNPHFFIQTFYSIFEYRKYSSLWLVWKHFWKEILRTLKIEEQYLKSLYKEIDEDLIRKVDNIDNWINSDWSLGDVIENFNSLDANNDSIQKDKFIEASNFLKVYFWNYLEKKIQVIKDEANILSEYKAWETIQIFSQYYRWMNKVLLNIENDNSEYIIFPKNDKFVIKTIKTGWFNSKKLLPREWIDDTPKWCTFVHTGLFIAEFTDINSIKEALWLIF